MLEAADIREWRGHDVVDADGHKIGEPEAVHVDTGTDLPSFGTVRVGLPTRTGSCSKQVKDAPSIGTRRRAARGRRRGDLQALRPDLRAGRRRRAAAGPPLSPPAEGRMR